MESHLSTSVILGLLMWVTFLPTATISRSSCNFPAIFNFGDSNSDTGGISAAFGQAPPPNGLTYFHTPSGRYSDGRLIIDFIGIFSFVSHTFTTYIQNPFQFTHAFSILHIKIKTLRYFNFFFFYIRSTVCKYVCFDASFFFWSFYDLDES